MSYSNEKASDTLVPQQDAQSILMNIGEIQSSFHKNSTNETTFLPVGYSLICSRYFKHTPPTYDEIEYAINDIEDEIEKVVSKIPASDSLIDGQNPLVYGTSVNLNLLPIFAYQKIYFDFYSNSQWEKHLAYAYNVDYWDGL